MSEVLMSIRVESVPWGCFTDSQMSNCNTALYFLWYLLLHANLLVAQQLKTLPDSSRRGYMFWSDVTANTTSRAKLDGSEVTVLVNSGLPAVGKSTMNENMFRV